MRGKLVKILGRLLPERKHPAEKQSKRFPWVAVVKFLGWSSMGLLGLLALWIVGGNLLAEQQEKKIEQEIAEWAKQVPKTEPNDSALKLPALAAKLGIKIGDYSNLKLDDYTRSHPDFIPSETEKKAFEDIREELGEYLDEQLAKPNDEIDAPSEKLRQYLESKAAVIDAIRNHLRDNEVPRWETDITYIMEGNIDFAFPITNLIVLQRIIALDIIEKKSQGQTQAALEMLEVSWKINQSIRDRPELISQFAARLTGRYLTGVMRKFDNLPAEWQQRLSEHDYRKSLLTSIELELIYVFNMLSKTSIKTIYESLLFWEISNHEKILYFLGPLSKPYIRLAVIDHMKIEKRAITNIYKYKQNICLLNSIEINEKLAWWNRLNLLQDVFSPNRTARFYQERRRMAAQYMLDLEFNQKILQIKALAAKEGKWPKSVPDMESLICPGFKWVYQVYPDGTMSISLSEQPEWLLEGVKDNRNLPLTYSDRTPPPKKQRLVGP